MNKLRFALLSSLLMTVACSPIGVLFETGRQARTSTHPVASANETTKQNQENFALNKKLNAANKRNAELEMIAAKLAKQLDMKTAELRELKNRPDPALVQEDTSMAASADVEVYHLGVDQGTQQIAKDAMQQKGFMPKYPSMPDNMGVAYSTTVFYYNDGFIPVAASLVKELAAALNSEVKIMRGVSPYGKNKLIVHIVGNGR